MRKRYILLIFILLILCPISTFGDVKNLRIHFLNVGEGDSILIETPEGENILVDTGNFISGYKVVKYLKQNNIYTLDHLIFTHPDLDHIGGAFFVLQMLKVKNVYDNGQNLAELVKYSDIYRWYEELVRKDKGYKTLRAKDIIFLDGLTLRVLWPPPSFTPSDFNANSLVIMLEYGRFRCLLTADLTIPGERKILEEKVDIKADILKIGHHGASDASCKEFLTAVSPRVAIISVNKANSRGYPAEEVISRLKKTGIKLYRTDVDGDIILTIYPSTDKEFEIKINKIKG